MIGPDALQRCCPLDNGRLALDGASKKETVPGSLGPLGRIPAELISDILLDLDLRSLTNFRGVSRAARYLTDSLPHYQAIFTHAPAMLRAYLSTQLGAFVSTRQLHRALCTASCAGCNDFGPFLYLLSCRRVCFICLVHSAHFLPITLSEAQAIYTLDSATSSTLPILLSLPGTYSNRQTTWRSRVPFVEKETAKQAGIKLHGSTEGMTAARRRNMEEDRLSGSGPHGHVQWRLEDRSFSSFDNKESNPFRFMGVLRIPWLDLGAGDRVSEG
ncbi:MAG: hypothetical protein M1838_002704 [Thelocarpon superellum]|nr:MAG: hypothetical protein M1838_002704 [Thelocarpon superellum]